VVVGIRRRKFRREHCYGTGQLVMAFGAGLLLAMFGNVHLALVIVSVALVYMACKAA
jgi:hypothetical protein